LILYVCTGIQTSVLPRREYRRSIAYSLKGQLLDILYDHANKHAVVSNGMMTSDLRESGEDGVTLKRQFTLFKTEVAD
jgi:hypothetical protein